MKRLIFLFVLALLVNPLSGYSEPPVGGRCSFDLAQYIGARELRDIDPSIKTALMDILRRLEKEPDSRLGREERLLLEAYNLEQAGDIARQIGRDEISKEFKRKLRRWGVFGAGGTLTIGFLAFISAQQLAERLGLETILNFKYGLSLDGNSQQELRFLQKILECPAIPPKGTNLIASQFYRAIDVEPYLETRESVQDIVLDALIESGEERTDATYRKLFLLYQRSGIVFCTPWGTAGELRLSSTEIDALLEFVESQPRHVVATFSKLRGIVNTNVGYKAEEFAANQLAEFTGEDGAELIADAEAKGENLRDTVANNVFGRMILEEVDKIKSEMEGRAVISKYVRRTRQIILFNGTERSSKPEVTRAVLRAAGTAISYDNGWIGRTNVEWKKIGFCRTRSGRWVSKPSVWFPGLRARLDPEQDFASSFYCYHQKGCSAEMQLNSFSRWTFIDKLLKNDAKPVAPSSVFNTDLRCAYFTDGIDAAAASEAMEEAESAILEPSPEDSSGGVVLSDDERDQLKPLVQALLLKNSMPYKEAAAELKRSSGGNAESLLNKAIDRKILVRSGDMVSIDPRFGKKLNTVDGLGQARKLANDLNSEDLLIRLRALQNSGQSFGFKDLPESFQAKMAQNPDLIKSERFIVKILANHGEISASEARKLFESEAEADAILSRLEEAGYIRGSWSSNWETDPVSGARKSVQFETIVLTNRFRELFLSGGSGVLGEARERATTTRDERSVEVAESLRRLLESLKYNDEVSLEHAMRMLENKHVDAQILLSLALAKGWVVAERGGTTLRLGSVVPPEGITRETLLDSLAGVLGSGLAGLPSNSPLDEIANQAQRQLGANAGMLEEAAKRLTSVFGAENIPQAAAKAARRNTELQKLRALEILLREFDDKEQINLADAYRALQDSGMNPQELISYAIQAGLLEPTQSGIGLKRGKKDISVLLDAIVRTRDLGAIAQRGSIVREGALKRPTNLTMAVVQILPLMYKYERYPDTEKLMEELGIAWTEFELIRVVLTQLQFIDPKRNLTRAGQSFLNQDLARKEMIVAAVFGSEDAWNPNQGFREPVEYYSDQYEDREKWNRIQSEIRAVFAEESFARLHAKYNLTPAVLDQDLLKESDEFGEISPEAIAQNKALLEQMLKNWKILFPEHKLGFWELVSPYSSPLGAIVESMNSGSDPFSSDIFQIGDNLPKVVRANVDERFADRRYTLKREFSEKLYYWLRVTFSELSPSQITEVLNNSFYESGESGIEYEHYAEFIKLGYPRRVPKKDFDRRLRELGFSDAMIARNNQVLLESREIGGTEYYFTKRVNNAYYDNFVENFIRKFHRHLQEAFAP